MAPESSEPRWIEAGANPFGVRVFDCRSFTRGAVSTSSDPEVARRFLSLRGDDGSQVRGTSPEDATNSACLLRYTKALGVSEGPLFRAAEMEIKWDIDLFDNRLYFRRSWSGQLAFTADIAQSAGLKILSVLAPGGKEAAQMAVRNVDFLVKSHLLRMEMPHPLPPDVPDEREKLLAYSFSMFGRVASFATYADTTQIPAPVP